MHHEQRRHGMSVARASMHPVTGRNRVALAPGQPRWRGRPGRLEVHYLTATDTATGTGLWLHHEVVAPTTGDAFARGWLAVFPPDRPPTCTRFGPSPAAPDPQSAWFHVDGVEMTARHARGHAGDLEWDLAFTLGGRPLWTFPEWAWRREVLPAAQMLPAPDVRVTGNVAGLDYDGTGALAHIYGHGNAQRWVWLHADLGGGDVLEVVAATARRRGLRALPALPLVQLRIGGVDWPADPLAVAPLLRAHVDDHAFRIHGTVGGRRLTAEVELPRERCVVLGYTDPDGATATCTNTERADALVRVEQLGLRGWRTRHEWTLHGTAHAEIGTRP